MKNAGITFVALLLAAAAGQARADAPMPEGYFASVASGGTVEVHVATSTSRGCPDDGLLRRNLATQEIVRVTTCSDDLTFVDQCVPAGDYQYGYATPLACVSTLGTEYFTTVTVTVADGAAADCTRTVDAPTAASSVPWSDSPFLCGGPDLGNDVHSSDGGFFGCDTGGGVLGTNLLVAAAGLLLWRWRPGRRTAERRMP